MACRSHRRRQCGPLQCSVRPRNPCPASRRGADRGQEPARQRVLHPAGIVRFRPSPGGGVVSATSSDEAYEVPSMAALLEPLSAFLEPLAFAAGAVLFREGDPTDSFYVIDEGEIRLDVHSDEVDSEATLAFVGPGSLLGEIGVLTGASRSATAIAHSDVKARRMSTEQIESVYQSHPADGLRLARL